MKNEQPTFIVPSPLPKQVGPPPDIAASSQARLFEQFGLKPNTPTFSQPSPRAMQPPPFGNAGSTSSVPNGGSPFSRPAGTSLQCQPPPPATKPPPLPPTPGQQVSYLPLFNQTASQRRVAVEYTAQFFGPPHAGKWHVKCMGGFLHIGVYQDRAVLADDSVDLTAVNNIEKGQGTGPSKQLAKEEAAKQAFYAMGWSN